MDKPKITILTGSPERGSRRLLTLRPRAWALLLLAGNSAKLRSLARHASHKYVHESHGLSSQILSLRLRLSRYCADRRQRQQPRMPAEFQNREQKKFRCPPKNR